jgi:cation diffusion facilitator family transporter
LETVVSIFIGMVLAAAGIGIGWEALSNLRQTQASTPGLIAALAAFFSIVSKESLYRWTAEKGKRFKSPALAANAWHQRTDAISSLPVLLAVSGAILFPGWSFLDRVGAALVAVFILHAALKIIWPGISELIDVAASTEICAEIESIASKNPDVYQVHDLRTRYISSSIQVDLHIVVDGSISVRDGHEIADKVRNRIIAEIPDVVDVIVHVDPQENGRQPSA